MSNTRTKIVTTFYRRLILYRRTLQPAPDPPQPVAGEDLQFDWLRGEEGIEEYCAYRPEARAEAIRTRFAAGHRCSVARAGGDLASTCWAVFGPGRIDVPYIHRVLVLESDQAYMYDAYTPPDYRGRGISGWRAVWLRRAMAAAGKRWVIALVAAENLAGLGFVRSADWERLGVWHQLGVRGRGVCWPRPLPGCRLSALESG